VNTPPARRGAAGRSRQLVIALVAIAVLGGGALAWRTWTAARDANAARTRVLAAIDVALAVPQPDGDELSRLAVQLQKLPDHDHAPELVAAHARLELARGRPERARDLFFAIASRPDAAPAEQSLGAAILLRVHEAGGDAAGAATTLQRALAMASAAYPTTASPGDLLVAWQAAERLGQHDRSREFAATLAASHADAPETVFVRLAMKFDPAAGAGAVAAAAAGLSPEPVEAAAMAVFAHLHAGDLRSAVASAEQGLGRGAGVAVVRWAAAVAFHACVVSENDRDARARWVQRRDAQLDWVRANSTDEARRQEAAAMRDQK
jgi:hypothetical protein